MKSIVLILALCLLYSSYSNGMSISDLNSQISSSIGKATQLSVTQEKQQTANKGGISASLHHLNSVLKSLKNFGFGVVSLVPPTLQKALREAFKSASTQRNVVSATLCLLSGSIQGTTTGLLNGLFETFGNALSDGINPNSAKIHQFLNRALATAIYLHENGKCGIRALVKSLLQLVKVAEGYVFSVPQDLLNIIGNGAVGGLVKRLNLDNLPRIIPEVLRGSTSGISDQFKKSFGNTLTKASTV